MNVNRLVSVLLGMSSFGGAASAQVESTGFEAEDGWDAGYSICGPEFAATCSYPVTHFCVPNDHVASQNCCEGDPNEDSGWFMWFGSQHCNEPHIDTAYPFSGLQHLRFERDPAAEEPSGCVFSCEATAYTPRAPAQPLAPTTVSFEISGSGMGVSSLRYIAGADDDPVGANTAFVSFRNTGELLIFDHARQESFTSHWDSGGVYRNFTIQLDPCSDAVQYFYAGKLILSTVFGPSQASTLQSAVFSTDNDSGVWDIDDYSVTRGAACPNPCGGVGTPACGVGPCAALKAVGVNGDQISPTHCIQARPGDLIEAEIYFSGWADLVNGVRVYEAQLDLLAGSVMGASGTVLPLGWNAPVVTVYCTSNANCPGAYPTCMPISEGGICVGPSHDPEQGVYIDTSRPDFILSGLTGIFVVRTLSLGFIRYAGIAEDSVGVLDQGVPRYAGTLVLNVSEDACGTFHFKFYNPDNLPTVERTYLADPSPSPQILYPSLSSLLVHVCEDDGLFCNGLESCASGNCVVTPPPDCDDGNECTSDFCKEDADACAHVATCGACCDSWNGDCEDAVSAADCNCLNCVWYPAGSCADFECKAEFVAIPTVSQWGLIVLTLLLLTGAKMAFGRRSVGSPPKPMG